MKIFCIKFNEVDYDQYEGFVMAAENEESVIKYLQKGNFEDDTTISLIDYPEGINWEAGYKIKELKPENYKKETIILDSFNAG